MNYNDAILNAIMDGIYAEYDEKIEKRDMMIKQMQDEKKSLEESYEKLIEFGKRHYEELISIYNPVSRCGQIPSGSEFFCDPLNQIVTRIEYNEMLLDHEFKNIGLFYDEWVLITYSDLEKRTGLNAKSLKKYLEEMEEKNMFKRKRHISGYLYLIHDE